MGKSGIFVGGIIFMLGCGLIFFGINFNKSVIGKIMTLIYGLIAIIIGNYMIFNHKNEDKIEELKRIKK